MGKMKELHQASQEICEMCNAYNMGMCSDCTKIIQLRGNITVKMKGGEIVGVAAQEERKILEAYRKSVGFDKLVKDIETRLRQ